MINGVTGTLGVGAVQLARAMGVSYIGGLGRNTEIMSAVSALDRRRVHIFNTLDADAEDFADRLRRETDGGLTGLVDFQGRGASIKSTLAVIGALRKGGYAVMVGAVEENVSLAYVALLATEISITGSVWFTTQEATEVAAMANTGSLDLSIWRSNIFPLDRINEGLSAAASRMGGFVNNIVAPSPDLSPE